MNRALHPMLRWRFIGVALLIIVVASVVGCNSTTFSKEYWEKYPEQRSKMIASLTRDNKLVGMTRLEVLKLLGEKEMLMNNPDTIEYFISSGNADVVGFMIYFDEKGMVYKFDTSRH